MDTGFFGAGVIDPRRSSECLLISSMCSIADFYMPLERRTSELLLCIDRRKQKGGCVNLSECVFHWSYDFMVGFLFLFAIFRLIVILLGRDGLWRLERSRESPSSASGPITDPSTTGNDARRRP
jgi:hypothetical protein